MQLDLKLRVQSHSQTQFTTSDDNHVGDDYFLTSGDKIRYFLEEGVVGEDRKLNRPKERAVNKMSGHSDSLLNALYSLGSL